MAASAFGSMNCLRKSSWKKMQKIRNWKKLCLAFLLVLCVSGIVFFGYFCPDSICALRGKSSYSFNSNYDAYLSRRFLQNQFSNTELDKDFNVDVHNQDVVVFLHMQKTGGSTFGRHLVRNLQVDPPCKCVKKKRRCECLNNNGTVWLFSRHSIGWQCGLHADWTELKDCVGSWFIDKYGKANRKFYYISILRDPVPRFISEWIHVSQRGATWKGVRLKCNGRNATLDEVPSCHRGEEWLGVSLKDFMSCESNLAINRQTRMLANLSLVNCYNASSMLPEERNKMLLRSAKENLLDLAFFGLTEYQTHTQFLFEHTLGLSFVEDFEQHEETHASSFNVSAEDIKAVTELNRLDVELYQFAKDLFLQRVKRAYVDDDIPVTGDLDKEIELSLSSSKEDWGRIKKNWEARVRDSETSSQNHRDEFRGFKTSSENHRERMRGSETSSQNHRDGMRGSETSSQNHRDGMRGSETSSQNLEKENGKKRKMSLGSSKEDWGRIKNWGGGNELRNSETSSQNGGTFVEGEGTEIWSKEEEEDSEMSSQKDDVTDYGKSFQNGRDGWRNSETSSQFRDSKTSQNLEKDERLSLNEQGGKSKIGEGGDKLRNSKTSSQNGGVETRDYETFSRKRGHEPRKSRMSSHKYEVRDYETFSQNRRDGMRNSNTFSPNGGDEMRNSQTSSQNRGYDLRNSGKFQKSFQNSRHNIMDELPQFDSSNRVKWKLNDNR